MKFVIRLMDGQNRMLGWAETRGETPGDGTVKTGPVQIPIDQTGRAGKISFHWCDVNVEARVEINPFNVDRGTVALLPGMTMMVVGEPAAGLPPIATRGNVTIEVPVGSMGVAGN